MGLNELINIAVIAGIFYIIYLRFVKKENPLEMLKESSERVLSKDHNYFRR